MFRNITNFVAGLLLAAAFVSCKSDGLEDTGDYPPAAMPESPSPETTPSPRRSVSDSTLQPGDVVELFVKEDDSFNGRYDVRERGDIIIPNVGRIPVRGMNVTEAGSRIRSELESSQLKNASVLLDRVHRAPRATPQPTGGGKPSASDMRMTIYMSGSVKRPGQHKVPIPASGRLGVYEAILMAGGFSNFGDPARVHILRNDETGKKRKIPVNIRDIEKGLSEDPMIGEGDIVVVPEKVLGF